MQSYLFLGGIALSEFVEQPSLELQSSQRDFVLAAGSESTVDGAEGLQSASKIRGVCKKRISLKASFLHKAITLLETFCNMMRPHFYFYCILPVVKSFADCLIIYSGILL